MSIIKTMNGQYKGSKCELCNRSLDEWQKPDDKRLLRFFWYFYLLFESFCDRHCKEEVKTLLKDILTKRNKIFKGQTVGNMTYVLDGLVSWNKMTSDQIVKFEATVSRLQPTGGIPTQFKTIKKCSHMF